MVLVPRLSWFWYLAIVVLVPRMILKNAEKQGYTRRLWPIFTTPKMSYIFLNLYNARRIFACAMRRLKPQIP